MFEQKKKIDIKMDIKFVNAKLWEQKATCKFGVNGHGSAIVSWSITRGIAAGDQRGRFPLFRGKGGRTSIRDGPSRQMSSYAEVGLSA